MRRIVFAAVLLLAPTAALAGDPDIGCGIGTQIWAGSSGVPAKVLGATTNGTLFQTVGITFGTIGCHQGGKVVADARLREFAAANLDGLARDMAQGDGEVLATFAGLMGVADSDRAAFYAFTQQNFARIFVSEETTELDVIASLDRLLAEEPALETYAHRQG